MSLIADPIINSKVGRRVTNWAVAQIRSKPMILMYHGVSMGNALGTLRNCEQKHIPLDAFILQLKALKRLRLVISLTEMIEGLRAGNEMSNTTAITFDDGYENNFLQAAPALADFSLPATFFISTGFIGTDRWMWTDKVEMILDRTEDNCVRVPHEDRLLPLSTYGEKCAALKIIKAGLKRMPNEKCLGAVEELGAQLKVTTGKISTDGDYRLMNWEQARKLSSSGFEVGAHSINHPILSQIPVAEAKKEILGSRDKIVNELGRCSTTFCYPNGKSSDYTPELVDFCGQFFRSAVSTNRGHANVGELYELRRFGTPVGSRVSNIEWMLLRER
ncbi:MAG: polysaccharide deacetylase family protein [Betaproteobacteria bacterium]